MGPVGPVNIGGVTVGDGHPVAFAAEIGTFFNQDLGLAERFLRAAGEAGAPLLKTEILHDPDVCLRATGLRHEYRHAGGGRTEDYRALIERKVVPLAGYRKLFALCRELGRPLIASVYDPEGVDFLTEHGGAAVKIARHNIDNLPLIRYAARTGLPVIFDAGVTYLDEVARAVRAAEAAGAGGVVVNHHPGQNPAPAAIHNLRVMQSYRDALRVPVGLSCHYRGEEILYLAIGMGAHLLEKGVVDDPDRVEQDVVSAVRLSELPAVLARVRACWEAIGAAPARLAEPRDLSVRKGLVARRRIPAGEALTLDNVRFAWPPVGISVAHWDTVDGQPAGRDLEAHDVIRWSDVRFAR